jgi:hypothetical protein
MDDDERVRFLSLLSKHYTETKCKWVANKVLVDAGKAVQGQRSDDIVHAILKKEPIRTRGRAGKSEGRFQFVGTTTLDYFESGHVLLTECDRDSDVSVVDNTGIIARPLKRRVTGGASRRRAKKKKGGKFF